MGSDLYISIDVRPAGRKTWSSLWDGPSTFLARGPVVDAFGTSEHAGDTARGYLTGAQIKERGEHPECPWRLDEPYWVRLIPGPEFCAIIRERRWAPLQDGDWAHLQCRPELRGFAALVESLISEGLEVVVWCWHSQ